MSPSVYRSNPRACLHTVGEDPRRFADDQDVVGGAVSPTISLQRLGYAYYPTQTAFTTTLPPNSPACTQQPGGQHGIFPPQSEHTGGVNALFADGSVRFTSNNIDTGNSSASLATGEGRYAATPSPYGVWGAMGSMNRGEVIGQF